MPLWLAQKGWSGVLLQFSTGNQVTFDVAVGFLVSYIFYLLVVKSPESKKRQRVKAYLGYRYDSFKSECIRTFLGTSKRLRQRASRQIEEPARV